MTPVEQLVLANHALDHEGVVDAYGHVSLRDPADAGTFLLAWSRSPGLVTAADILAFDLAGAPRGVENRPLYVERFIHAAIYAARPDVNAVVHSHAEDVLPFGVSAQVPFRPLIHSASGLGGPVPVWDIADRFGETDLLVRTIEQGRDLARALAGGTACLMRGHGFVAAAPTLIEAVRLAVYLPKNARVQAKALALGGAVRFLSEGEMEARRFDPARPGKAADYDPAGPGLRRAWDYWLAKLGPCGCGRDGSAP